MLSIAAFCSALKLFNLSANKFLNSDKAETAFGLEGAILLAFKCLLYNRKPKNLLHRNMSVQQELQWLLQRNGPMGKKSLLNPMIAVIRLFFTNFQG